MRVISMVPSLTETLLSAQDSFVVVGRTRFCVHPQAKVATLPVVGGTKDIDWSAVDQLKPDLIIFDQEENPKKFATECKYPWMALHVVGIESVAPQFLMLAEGLQSEGIKELAKRWQRVEEAPPARWHFDLVPGELCAWSSARHFDRNFDRLVYVIWSKPWMTVSSDTFIGSVLKKLGAESYLQKFEKKYPEFNISDLETERTFFLFSSEPYPFAKKEDEILALNLPGASLVDGELYSWFGLRSLLFLEKALGLTR